MTKIFEPIMHSTIIYIDKILLFSSTIEERMALLQKFLSLVQSYWIILSKKKIIIGIDSIDFMSITLKEGKIQLQPHIYTKLQEFPDTALMKKHL